MVTGIEAGPWNTIYGPLVTISMVYCRNQSYDNAPQALSVKFIVLQEYSMIESACLMHFQHLEGRSEASFWAMKESVSSMGESTSSANFFGKKKKRTSSTNLETPPTLSWFEPRKHPPKLTSWWRHKSDVVHETTYNPVVIHIMDWNPATAGVWIQRTLHQYSICINPLCCNTQRFLLRNPEHGWIPHKFREWYMCLIIAEPPGNPPVVTHDASRTVFPAVLGMAVVLDRSETIHSIGDSGVEVKPIKRFPSFSSILIRFGIWRN